MQPSGTIQIVQNEEPGHNIEKGARSPLKWHIDSDGCGLSPNNFCEMRNFKWTRSLKCSIRLVEYSKSSQSHHHETTKVLCNSMSNRWERIAIFKLQHEPQRFVREEKAFKYVSMCLKQSHQELEVHKDRALYLYLQFHVCQAR